MTDLMTQDINAQIEIISGIESIEEAVKYLKQLDALKTMLESMRVFEEQSIKFAQLHAASLLRIVELGGVAELKGYARRTAEWLSELSEEEKAKYIGMCSDGATIIYVWKTYVADPEKTRDRLEQIIFLQERAVEEAQEKGIVDLKFYSEQIRKNSPSNELANQYIDGMRNNLRKAGAVGVGAGVATMDPFLQTNYYVMPPEGDSDYNFSDEIVKACETRYKNICHSVASLRSLVKKAKPYFGFEKCISSYNLAHGYYTETELLVMCMLADLGCLTDGFYVDQYMHEKMVERNQEENYSSAREYFRDRCRHNEEKKEDRMEAAS